MELYLQFPSTLMFISMGLKIWFDSEKKLIRRDYKSASGNDPDPTSEIFDFNLGK